MTHKNNKVPQNGLPAELISHINHLGNLLKNLPRNLPLDPRQSESCYSFGLEMELVEEEGVLFAFNRNLEKLRLIKFLQEGALFSENGVDIVNSVWESWRG